MEEKRQRGRPKVLFGFQQVHIKFHMEIYNSIKDFADSRMMSFSQAVRYLVEVGLKHTQGEK